MWPGDRRAWLRVGLLVAGMLLLPTLVWFLFPIRRTGAAPAASQRSSATQAAAAPSADVTGARRPTSAKPEGPTVREVRGVVLDATGHAVERATVSCIDRDDVTAVTDGKGAFKLPGAAVGCTAVATHDAHGKTTTTTLSGSGPNRLEFIPSGTINGEVVDDAGRAVAKYALAIESFVAAEGMPTQSPSSQQRAIDDPRGAFQWGGLPPGTYTLVARAPGFPPGRSDSIEIELGKTVTTKIVLPQGGKLSGRVTDASTGKGLSGVNVEVGGGAVTTGADGRYTLDGIPTTGVFTVSFNLEGYRRKMVTIPAGSSLTQDAALSAGEGGVEYGGIGAVLRPPMAAGAMPFAAPAGKGPVIVASLMPGGPAAVAGVRVGDEIAEIDGQATAGLVLSEVLDRLRGPEGTVVKLRLSRDGGQTVDVDVTRKVVVR